MFQVASRYAKSLLGLAEEQKALEEVHSDMVLFSKVCEENYPFVLMLRNPIIKHDKKYHILEELFMDKVHEITMAIFRIICRKNREAALPSIATEFQNQYNVAKGIQSATVTTAFPLDDGLRDAFRDVVQRISNKSVELKEMIDEDVIGGYRLKIGDRQLDDTVKHQLDTLALKFKENIHKK